MLHEKGHHCGSTALRDALRLKGLLLTEAQVFGLGSGLGFALYDGDVQLTPPQPGRFFVGRSAGFERDLCTTLGAELEEEQFASADEAWPRIEALANAGEFPLVYTDIFHLPYVGARGHWYAHLVGVAGVRDGVAQLADNGYAELQPCAIEDLQRALGTGLPVRVDGSVSVLHLSTAGAVTERATRDAIVRNAYAMTEDAAPGTGVLGLHALPDELRAWEDRTDRERCLRMGGQVVEVRGTGGGLFRKLYAQFLEEAGFPELASLARVSASRFTTLALALEAARTTGRTAEAAEAAEGCAQAEDALWARALE